MRLGWAREQLRCALAEPNAPAAALAEHEKRLSAEEAARPRTLLTLDTP